MTCNATLGLTLGDLACQHHASRVGIETAVGLELGPEPVSGFRDRSPVVST